MHEGAEEQISPKRQLYPGANQPKISGGIGFGQPDPIVTVLQGKSPHGLPTVRKQAIAAEYVPVEESTVHEFNTPLPVVGRPGVIFGQGSVVVVTTHGKFCLSGIAGVEGGEQVDIAVEQGDIYCGLVFEIHFGVQGHIAVGALAIQAKRK